MAVLLALLLVTSVTLRTQGSPTPPGPAAAAPVQPIPYSHKKHVALGLECRTCHVNPDPGKLMTFPPTAFCMGCHQSIAADRPAIQKLAGFAASGTPVPWVRVYRLPDYVFWKHATHLKAGVDLRRVPRPGRRARRHRAGNQRRHDGRLPRLSRQTPGLHRLRRLPRAAPMIAEPTAS